MEWAGEVFADWALQSPLYLVWVLGIVLCVVYRRRLGRTWALAPSALAILLVVSVAATFLERWLIASWVAARRPVEGLATALAALRGARGVLSAGAWVLLLVAMVAPRQRAGEPGPGKMAA
ncbi:MAG: hypothetical protein QME94_09010 [Anaerolineae bacterium]|nr:hypothetical protein [Anaerolineae bacterium]